MFVLHFSFLTNVAHLKEREHEMKVQITKVRQVDRGPDDIRFIVD